jgi:hypothetical protein
MTAGSMAVSLAFEREQKRHSPAGRAKFCDSLIQYRCGFLEKDDP